MNIEDNQILLSGIESYDAPREETLIKINFCLFSFGEGFIWEKAGRARHDWRARDTAAMAAAPLTAGGWWLTAGG
ncbi:hypothetical protein [Nitrosospira sp. NpAV]|uniref:hypothetical protein n=1 Tax=Nitrosospira sp. NpAV TaxID=58133 RepID=UPI00059EDD9E|nr:hypothetical protein [Nitrosospira sp. NpAV]KIO49754.1 hypothetical protein SQ11_04170 [Nitrosospira sp. NpAV]